MADKLSDIIKNHLIVILAGCVLLGVSLTGSGILFFTKLADLKWRQEGSFMSIIDIEKEYVTKEDYERIERHLQIVLSIDQNVNSDEIFVLYDGFEKIIAALENSMFLDTYLVQAYNFHARRLNVLIPSSEIPTFPEPEVDDLVSGVRGVLASAILASNILKGEYVCTTRTDQ